MTVPLRAAFYLRVSTARQNTMFRFPTRSESRLLQTITAKNSVNSVPIQGLKWRKGWDSNPRWSCPHGGFQDRCLKPLGHPSLLFSMAAPIAASTFRTARCCMARGLRPTGRA